MKLIDNRRFQYKKGDHYMIDDFTGQKMRASEARKNWEGYWVHKDNFELKHPQLSVKGIKDKQSVLPQRPRDTFSQVGVNELLQSEDFSTTWTLTNATIDDNVQVNSQPVMASNGQDTADALIDDGTTGEHSVQQTTTTLSPLVAVVASVEALRGSVAHIVIKVEEAGDDTNALHVWFNLADGSVGTSTNVGTGTSVTGRIDRRSYDGDVWFRCTVLGTPSTSGTTGTTVVLQAADADNSSSYTGTSANALILWGAMAYAGTTIGNYVKTTTTAYSQTALGADL